jgi:hypothetical protein
VKDVHVVERVPDGLFGRLVVDTVDVQITEVQAAAAAAVDHGRVELDRRRGEQRSHPILSANARIAATENVSIGPAGFFESRTIRRSSVAATSTHAAMVGSLLRVLLRQFNCFFFVVYKKAR